MSKTALITGATGFLGSNICSYLIAKGWTVIVAKRKESDLAKLADCKSNIAHICDIEKDDLEFIFNRWHCDVVIHTAVSYGRDGQSPTEVLDSNLRFGLRILEVAARAGCPQFVNTGSQLPRFLSAYSLSKIQFGEWGKLLSSNIQFVDLKIELMYGPKDNQKSFVSWLLHQFKSAKPEILLTPGTQERDFVHVSDVVSAIEAVFEKRKMLPAYSSIDVGSGQICEIRQFILLARDIWEEITREKVKAKLKFGAIQYRQGENMKVNENLDPLYNLGWRPKIQIRDGLKALVENIRFEYSQAAKSINDTD